ncbi:hypothetical protein [Phytohabitans aurantiacus]|uniref:Uncharacterized protein n=1 Tax=Phytohabitans aurantiacus TaxID=3016789 RepID=A0ABQ5R845_9ACTN|nr:hypothetical protein [Phytohabitans aurantiacus]GLI02563.1 hypothetical protein Pa4123_78410 [Phytohabitans aurantiacus]
MSTQVVHPQRLAWDAARVVVRALGSVEVLKWLHGQMAARLGPAQAQALVASRDRLWGNPRPDAPHVEAGIWRARLADLVAADGSLATPISEITAEGAVRLAHATDVMVHGELALIDGPRVIDLDVHRP